MSTVDVQEAKTQFSRLLERAEAGERVVITRAGRPVVELCAITRSEIVFGTLAGQVVIDDESFAAADADIAAMWNESLEVGRCC